jgi:hypothetical protein
VYNKFYRSDNAGETWAIKSSTIQSDADSVEFYPPFVLDSSDPSVCYFGNHKLWRSPNKADTWTAITSPLDGNITSIAVHTSSSNIIFVSTSQGHVYKIEKTGATWAIGDVTTREITGSGIPSGLYTSDLAVDTSGNVWLTVSSVIWTEDTGEFSNNHVYMLSAGSSTWVSRSNGLAQANPINTIVIDPTNNNRLFCGGDIGIFRTETAGTNWIPWDQGIPNVPIFDLVIHGPRRLLRAGTHGRGIWERPIDSMSCSMVDVYMRDNIIDSGRIQPSPETSSHPFNPSVGVYHWQSVDIKVDAPEPAFQTSSAISDYLSFEETIEHRSPSRGQNNRFYVQVHNRGINKATNVIVRAFFGRASAGLPPIPLDFWSGGRPFTGSPSGSDWTPIGNAINLGDLEPDIPKIAEWDWFVPSSAPDHSCLLALMTCDQEPLAGTSIYNADDLVRNKKQVTLKNLHVVSHVGGGIQPKDAIIIEMHSQGSGLVYDLGIQWGTLPINTELLVAFEKLPQNEKVVLANENELKKEGVRVVKGKDKFKEKIDYECGETRQFDLNHVYKMVLSKDEKNMRLSRIPLVRLPKPKDLKNTALLIAIKIVLPKKLNKEVQFDVLQMLNNKIIGGSTYLLRISES